jgi:hypothetical protein
MRSTMGCIYFVNAFLVTFNGSDAYLFKAPTHCWDRDSSVSIATTIRAEPLVNRGSIPGCGIRDFSRFKSTQAGYETNPASYPMGLRDCIPNNKAAETWSWPLTPIYCRGFERLLLQ